MIAIGEVVHWFVLLVDDTNAGFVGAAGDVFDVFGRLAHLFQLRVDSLGGFNSGLGMEFG